MTTVFRRLNAWIQKSDSPPDPIGDALFRLNKALLVYVALPALIVISALLLLR